MEKYNNFENITLGLPRIKEVRAIKGQKSDKSVKSKYRKRGDKWEGRVRINGEQYSLYDINERRLDLRIETVKDNYEKLLQIEEQYKSFVGTIEILNEKYNEEKNRYEFREELGRCHDVKKYLKGTYE